jgi:crotonobetainyl-CoA:carnitine CoA-transferase CaiB-like acyl-CoA transferase
MRNPGASDPALSSAVFAPLAGVRIIDFSTNMAGPYATMILAQLGADVVKVEAPGGDDARAWAPEVDGASVVHRHMNAGKRGIVLDLGTTAGREAALAIAARSDVLLQSMRPGVAERIGIGEEAARAVNPDILSARSARGRLVANCRAMILWFRPSPGSCG